MNKGKSLLAPILFNLFELFCIVLFGVVLGTSYSTIAIMLATWTVARAFIKEPMHYKSPVKCFIMSLLIFISLFLATKVNLFLGLILLIFDCYVLSSHGNIKEIAETAEQVNNNMFQWNSIGTRRNSNYQDLIRFVETDYDNPTLVEYLRYWEKYYPDRYEIFEMFFKRRMTYDMIIKEKGFKDTTKIKNECKHIYLVLEVPLGLKPLR